MSASTFTNLYYKRTAGTPKACYVCSKPTTTVLSTISTVDFLYTCPTHLTDTGFASPFVDPEAAKPPALSQEDIGKVIAEWEDRQKRKKEKEEKDKKDKAAKDNDSKDQESKKDSKNSKDADDAPPSSLSPKIAPLPTHERFTLHRDMFAMRLREHRKRRQTAQAKDLAPRLPGAPRGTL